MKMIKPILLSVLLLISTTGITLNKHYCNGKLANVFLLPHLTACCNLDMSMGDEACDSEVLEFIVDDSFDFHNVKLNLSNSSACTWLPVSLPKITTNNLNSKTSESAFASPPGDGVKIYLRVESFLN